MARVNVELKALVDRRFVALGRALGIKQPVLARAVGLGLMCRVWNECQETGRYELTAEAIDEAAEWPGLAALISRPSIDLGEVTPTGIRLRGTANRVEWLEKKRESGKLGAPYGHLGGRPKKTPQEPLEGFTEKPPPALAPALALTRREDPDARASKDQEPRTPEPPSEAAELASYLLEAIRSHTPDYQVQGTLEGWAREIGLAMQVDKRSAAQIRAAVDFAHRDDGDAFWRPAVLNGAKLRSHLAKLDAQRMRAQRRAKPATEPRPVPPLYTAPEQPPADVTPDEAKALLGSVFEVNHGGE